MRPLKLNPDRLFSSDPETRAIARALYSSIAQVPIISPHGHTDARWFAENEPFTDATALFITPDHYVLRMLFSQGLTMADLGVEAPGAPAPVSARSAWHTFAKNYFLFRGTPSRMWLDWVFAEVFGLEVALEAGTADLYFDHINAALAQPDFLPRALFERYNIEVIATTDAALDPLTHHAAIRASKWHGRVITTYRPDNVVDPEFEGFADNLRVFGELTGEDTSDYTGYLNAHRKRRSFFKQMGATASDHGHPTANTADLSVSEAQALFARITGDAPTAQDCERFRAHMLTVMAEMSLEDGLVMQIHPGVYRNHNQALFQAYGRDKGGDIPLATDYVHALKPLLDRFGNAPDLTIILFTLDETSYARELAPLAGHYPALKLGPPWWFHDSPEGMRRFREQITETAGFYNTVGFNDDTRAFLSIPARHDVARRMDCNWLAQLVAEHRLDESEAADLAHDLAYSLAKDAYKL